MTEEYMTSAELTQEISELKMRLALQIEYEKELEAVLKEASVQDTDDVQMEEMHRQTLQQIDKAYSEVKKTKKKQYNGRRAGKLILIAATLLIVSISSAFATMRMVQVGILKLKMQRYQAYSTFEFVPAGETLEVPEVWEGDFYPTYIPAGYHLMDASCISVGYVDENGRRLTIFEDTKDNRMNLDTENATISYGRINGYKATLIEKNGWVTIIWSNNIKLFMVDMQGEKDTAIRIAESFIYMN